MQIEKAGNVGIGTGALGNALGKVDISNGAMSLVVGADNSSETRTTATQKISRIGTIHYTNSEEIVSMLHCVSDVSYSNLNIGGGTGMMNAVTRLGFFTAPNNTTVTGTERMCILTNGNVGVNKAVPTEKLDVDGNIQASAEVRAGTKVVIANKVEQVYDAVNQSLKFNFL